MKNNLSVETKSGHRSRRHDLRALRRGPVGPARRGVLPANRIAMVSILDRRTYRNLFAAQVLSLIGTGLTTVALGLLFDLAGTGAGASAGHLPRRQADRLSRRRPSRARWPSRVPRRAFW